MFKKLLKNKKIKSLSKITKQFQISIIIALIGLLLIGAGLSISKISTAKQEPQFIDSESSQEAEGNTVVDISGAVEKPGVYKFSSDTRVMEVIEKAGGFSSEADREWVAKSLNLAEKITDGQKIFIPAKGQLASSGSGGAVAGTVTEGKVNINTASESQLDSLPDIGPVRAGKIISNRPYKSLEELLSKKVVGESTFEKIKDKISVF